MNGSENSAPEMRPAASLTGSLLARRGGARPAMRRQPMAGPAPVPTHEDLGWNDMGEETPVAALVETSAVAEEAEAPLSPISRQIAALAERINAAPPAKKSVRARPATLTGVARKAAFTLRIDADRHLRLRLLSALTNRSAQHLLIEALDTMIAQNDQLRDLADQVDAGPTARAANAKWGS